MSYSEIRGIKMALMGPLAGIGDSLSQFCLAPLVLHHLRFHGNGRHLHCTAVFLLAMNGVLLMLKLVMGNYGMKLGTSMIDKLSEKMGAISDAAGMIGVTVIAGLAAAFVKINVAVSLAAGEMQEEVFSNPLWISKPCWIRLRRHFCQSSTPC